MYKIMVIWVRLAIIILCAPSMPSRAWLGDLGYPTARSFSLGRGDTIVFFVPVFFTNISSLVHVAGFE